MRSILIIIITALVVGIVGGIMLPIIRRGEVEGVNTIREEKEYWLLLHRKSNKEYVYNGVPGDIMHSELIKTFNVKIGIPGKRPTPLPQKLGYAYWVIESEEKVVGNPETDIF